MVESNETLCNEMNIVKAFPCNFMLQLTQSPGLGTELLVRGNT